MHYLHQIIILLRQSPFRLTKPCNATSLLLLWHCSASLILGVLLLYKTTSKTLMVCFVRDLKLTSYSLKIIHYQLFISLSKLALSKDILQHMMIQLNYTGR